MLLAAYRGLMAVGGPAIRAWLAVRRASGKEDADRFAERLGWPGGERPAGPLVWLHGASVGEGLSMLPLIDALARARPDARFLVTTGTVTSARLLADRLPSRAQHQFVPVDRRAYVRRFLAYWRPDLALWLESELWPDLIDETAAHGIPMVLLNGRMSPRSYGRWRRAPAAAAGLLSRFALCTGQTVEDAARFQALGASGARCLGNLKFAAPLLPVDDGELQKAGRRLADRPRWLATSTHPGEEAIAGRIHARLEAGHPGLLTTIVPRHPERGTAVTAELRAMGLRVARRAAGEVPEATTQVHVADTMGELGLMYRLHDLVFVGKSLAADGGQNPLEPARLGCALLFGPGMTNFSEIASRLLGAGAAVTVEDEAGLGDALESHLADPASRARRGAAARAVAESESAVLDRAMEALAPFLAAVPLGQPCHADT